MIATEGEKGGATQHTMDEKRNLILIKGENKTWQIERCHYDPKDQRYHVTFDNGKTYPYGYSSVQWLKDPEVLNPLLYQISTTGTPYGNIQGIYVFRGNDEWWHLVFEGDRKHTYRRSELKISKSCLDNNRAQSKLHYLRDIAGINELKNDDGEVLLKKQYERLSFVGEDSALAAYLYPEKYKIKSIKAGPLIFPFGGNASQFKAVVNALSKQMSVIQGPPGTGKTQTILNIIANLLIRGKTIQVVSNNNSATQNVLDKLASPKYNMGFLVATLGKRENKQAFIDGQTGLYPYMEDWKRTPADLFALQTKVAELSKEVAEHFAKQERLAVAKQELDALEVETQYFGQFCEDTKLVHPTKKPRKSLRSEQVLRTLQECEQLSEKEQPFSLWHKLKSSVLYGIYEWKFHDNDIGSIITYLQSLFYTTKRTELRNEIASLQESLAQVDAKQKMDMLTKQSMEYLKAVLYNRYGGKVVRPRFAMDAIWKQPFEILKEYPIILSTTFSSRSCLKDAAYDYLIMDEASQVDLATGALALASAKNAVIVGDLKQLPNVIPEDQRKLSEAVFQSYQLPEGYNYADNSFLKSICTVIPDVPQTLLREHYRCHPKIIGFCNQKFYQNQLVIMTEDHDESDTLCVFRTVEGQHHRRHINQRQIDVTMSEVLPWLEGTAPEDIGIIAPYRAQVKEFAKATQGKGVEVDTVHKFQGREKDAIVITTVDDEVTDFSDDPYLLNVAISRAKKKLCLVVSGNEQPADSNIKDLVAYIEYHNFDVVDSELYSVFDLLYQQYTQQRMEFLQKHKRISEYDSENLMYAAICDMLRGMPELPLNVICHQKVRLLIRDHNKMTEEERRYVTHPNTHVDFLIYNRITKMPVLAIEVDGFHYHKEGTRQAERDRMKDEIFAKYGIPLLRLPTNGSGEIRRIKEIIYPAEIK